MLSCLKAKYFLEQQPKSNQGVRKDCKITQFFVDTFFYYIVHFPTTTNTTKYMYLIALGMYT